MEHEANDGGVPNLDGQAKERVEAVCIFDAQVSVVGEPVRDVNFIPRVMRTLASRGLGEHGHCFRSAEDMPAGGERISDVVGDEVSGRPNIVGYGGYFEVFF